MSTWLKVLAPIIIILLVIQLPVFQPGKNYAEADPVNDIATAYEVPMDILMIVYNSCYDCHSNYTEEYPWYYTVQPAGWWMANHIENAKEHLNFSEFAQYSSKIAAHKFKEIQKVMEMQTMPLQSYLWMHEDARLTDEEYKKVANWAEKMHAKVLAKVDSSKNQ